MDNFIHQILNGLVLGSVYAIIALGYTMVYGILGIINFAHGDVLMVGAMVALSAIGVLQNHFPNMNHALVLVVALIVAAVVCSVVGYTIERVAYRPLRRAPRLAPLITAIGVSIVLQNIAMMIWGRSYFSFPDVINVKSYTGAVLTDQQIFIVLLSAALMGGLLWVVHRTRLGLAMRATAQNLPIAGL